ncbi:hypothetical protein GQ44DRAFT_705227 [Phaeosphaeriaceae sp. PMI808]|nr:hypothetical protein GQ44DRAFT_705227 [Phaeosphaeriaceae sp. PMI808]
MGKEQSYLEFQSSKSPVLNHAETKLSAYTPTPSGSFDVSTQWPQSQFDSQISPYFSDATYHDYQVPYLDH